MSIGIKETQDVLAGLQALCVELIVEVKKLGALNGGMVVLEDLLASGSPVHAKLADAIAGIQLVPAEIADIDLMEGISLGHDALEFEKAIVAALKTV